MRPLDLCEACGREVPPHDRVEMELAVGDMMCPTPMVFHGECYARASELWQPDPDSYCTHDPLFPETARWVLPEQRGK